MAESGRDGGRERELPRGRNATGRCNLTLVVERVPALCVGSLVRAGCEATPVSACFPGPLCGRFRDWVSRPTRCSTRHGGLAEALRQVRPGSSPDQDEARTVLSAVNQAQGSERAARQSSWDIRPPGIYPLLGKVPARVLGDQTEDRREPLQSSRAEHGLVVSG